MASTKLVKAVLTAFTEPESVRLLVLAPVTLSPVVAVVFNKPVLSEILTLTVADPAEASLTAKPLTNTDLPDTKLLPVPVVMVGAVMAAAVVVTVVVVLIRLVTGGMGEYFCVLLLPAT